MKIIRVVVGSIILLLNFLTWPKAKKRSTEAQALVDSETKFLTLYHFKACPFCVKVRRKIQSLNLEIQKFDTKRDSVAREALVRATGRTQVPVLKIEAADGTVKWMAESSDINAYLESRFANA